MARKKTSIKVGELRKVAAETFAAPASSHHIVDSARHELTKMREEAAEFGFSDADVIRAVMTPLFKKAKGCECFSCKSRRSGGLSDSDWDDRKIEVNAG